MKVMKLALLGTAALAAVSVSARADDLADLKAQIEALNSRISQLEAAPAVPAGYQLLSVANAPAIVVPSLDIDPAYGKMATTIGILPTADVPASTTIQWSGYARAALVHSDTDREELWLDAAGVVTHSHTYDIKSTDILARGQLKVVGTTDTAVGEVGAQIQLRGNFEGLGNADVIMNEAWGWWKMTPELTLGGGFTGTLANIGYGYDGACNCYYTDNAPVGLNPGDRTQMRLSYASGPLSFAIALEDADLSYNPDTLGVAGEIKYAGDMFSGEVSAGWWDGGSSYSDQWQVGVGLGFSLDPVSLSLAAGMGETWSARYADGDDYWKVSALASANLSDSVHAEVAVGYASWNGANTHVITTRSVDGDTLAVLAGFYYDPVSQLTIGLEGEWYETDLSGSAAGAAPVPTYSLNEEVWQVDLVTVFRF
jgi:hypothetical protein